MKIFLSFSSEQREQAEHVYLALIDSGHEVFFDARELPPGKAVHSTIADWLRKNGDLLIFLISPSSVAHGRYPLSELEIAKSKWKSPRGRVIPVLAEPTPMESIPPYLRAVSILVPKGDLAAEVANAVANHRRPPRVPWRQARTVGYAAIATALILLVFIALGARVSDFHAGVFVLAALLGIVVTWGAQLILHRFAARGS